jgi:hypothetical protein
MQPRNVIRIICVPEDDGVAYAVAVSDRLRIVIFDPPSVIIAHGMLNDHQDSGHLVLLNLTSSESKSLCRG